MSKKPTKSSRKFDPATYNSFVGSLELHNISVVNATMNARTSYWSSESAPRVSFEIEGALINPSDAHIFVVFARVAVDFEDSDGEREGDVSVTHALEYVSAVECTEAILDVFSANNVQFHVWPYAREFIQSSVTRFGWPPFILPPYVPTPRRKSRSESETESSERSK